MDCNKDEAIKAKGVAEKKLEIKDYEGAKKFALKAQQLYSDVDGILQMMTVIDVHCSAAQMVGTEMDWYNILKVEIKADEASIKKQYRKLALLLHPDKNKLAGAEAAFKLIGEAHRVLTDRDKRSRYDYLLKVHRERKPMQKSTFPVPRQPGANNGYGNVSRTQFTSVNLQGGQNQPGMNQSTFWTVCPFCTMRYQYYRDILNRALRCQNCMKPFIAYDLNVQGVPSGANSAQPAAPQQHKFSQDGCKVGPQSSGQNLSSTAGHQGHMNPAAAASSSFANKGTTNVDRGNKIGAEKKENVKGATKTESQKKSNCNGDTRHAGKKKRKSASESSESCDTSSSEEFEIPDNFRVPEGRNTRRSSRQKRQVVYNEDGDSEDDTVGLPKDNKSSTVEEDQKKKAAGKPTKPDGLATGATEDILKTEQEPQDGNKAAAADGTEGKSTSDVTSEPDSQDKTYPDPEFIEVPDPEFYVFDNDRKEDCFRRDQLWAVYDNVDGMPRFYARIKHIYTTGFKVRITWLEPDPDDQDEIDWVGGDLPVSCGTFKYGKSEVTEDVNMFSHVVVNEKSIKRGSLVIYPKKGETWALYKNWDIKWNSDPDNHRDFAYDFVEIISDYDEKSGILVGYVEKVKGFVSLFRPDKEVAPVNIAPNELYRFSHLVPCYRTTGKERDGVAEGSFELDPASLPGNLVKVNDM